VKKANGQIIACNEVRRRPRAVRRRRATTAARPHAAVGWNGAPAREIACSTPGTRVRLGHPWCALSLSRCSLQIFERYPTTVKNYGIWVRYQSRTGYHNAYKEFRDVTLNGAVEQMYQEMGSRHRVRGPCLQIIKTARVKAADCKRDAIKQFHDSKISFPLTRRVVRFARSRGRRAARAGSRAAGSAKRSREGLSLAARACAAALAVGSRWPAGAACRCGRPGAWRSGTCRPGDGPTS
jgi:ribosomal protein L20A (L18A)